VGEDMDVRWFGRYEETWIAMRFMRVGGYVMVGNCPLIDQPGFWCDLRENTSSLQGPPR
jgi:hypothetical protein